jgi:hypothetical protein
MRIPEERLFFIPKKTYLSESNMSVSVPLTQVIAMQPRDAFSRPTPTCVLVTWLLCFPHIVPNAFLEICIR